MGIRVLRDQAMCVALSSALAGTAGILVCQQIGIVSPFVGISYGLKGLVALIVGRSLRGTAITATALGLTEALVVGYWSSTYRDLVVYGLLVAFVVTRSRREVPALA